MNFGQKLPPIRTGSFGNRGSGDLTSPQSGSGEIPMPGPHNGHMPMTIPGHTRASSQYGAGFAADRSPPKQKSTSHVPCKFFPTGQCQAGAACQFSHDLNPVTQNAPCKYFAKGSCKFGQGCALMHVLPNGSIVNVNRGTRGGQGYGRRNTHNGHMYQHNNAAHMAINTNESGLPSSDHMPPYQHPGLGSSYTHQPASPIFKGEMYPGEISPPYGSPQNDYLNPVRSPPRTGIRARDAPMPSSWDSQGISQAARHGPFAASVPGRIGLESPISQLGNHIARDQTFGDTPNLDGVLHGLGSSPRGQETMTFPKRPLHSERFARSRPFLSSSLNTPNAQFSAFDDSTPDADDSDDSAGEGCIPSSLHHELLSDDEPRRISRGDLGEDENTSHWSTAPRRIVSNGANVEMKTGSLSPHSASPSRYSAIFGVRKPDANRKTESDTTSLAGFGHVGSPLRPSNLRTSSTHTSSPPEVVGSSSLSMLTSQLQRAKLNDSTSGSPTTGSGFLSPSASANALPSRVAPTSSPRFVQGSGSVERSLSGSYSNTLGRERIEEESIFSMEEETAVLGESEAEPITHPPRNAWSMGPPRIGSVGVIGSQRNK